MGTWRYLYYRWLNVPRYFFVARAFEKTEQMSLENQKFEIEDEFERFMHLHKIPSMVELIKIPIELLIKMDGFGWRMVVEVHRLKQT